MQLRQCDVLKSFLIGMIFCLCLKGFSQSTNTFKVLTVGFYNVENLFDTINNPVTYDDDRTPAGKDRWTSVKYRDKVKNIAYTISQIGREVTQSNPVIIGLAEVENRDVVEDLISSTVLRSTAYGIVHKDSPDRRGIDVAMIYDKKLFKLINYKLHPLILYDADEPSKRVYTRDQLVVSGLLDHDLIHIIVNHWPSRSGGEARSSYKREAAAKLNVRIIDSLQASTPDAKIISMGDYNDDPVNKSIKKILGARRKKQKVKPMGLYNPMESMYKSGMGTLAYRDTWNLFDQIILSEPFLRKEYNGYRLYKPGILNKDFLLTPSGRYKGYPFRSYANGSYTGGYSDHFPVFVYLIKKAEMKK